MLQKKLIFTLAVALLATLVHPAADAEQRRVDETRVAKSDGFVEISVVRGNLDIEGWGRDEISVEGRLDEQTREFVFDTDGNGAVIAVRLPNNTNDWCCNEGSDLRIRVPENSHISVTTVSTEVDVSNISGGIELGGVSGDVTLVDVHNRVNVTSVSGEIQLRNADGKIRLKSVSGEVVAEDVRGEGSFKSVSGEVRIRNYDGELVTESVSGDIDLVDVVYSELRGSTVSGDVEVNGRMKENGLLEFDSVSGSLRAKFKGEVNARFDLQTRSGSVRNRLSEHEATKSRYVRDETLRMTLGDGSGEVMLETRSGDVIVTH
ncbi:MAG: DUF4097 family beta strand repeat protein [Pseudomonadales bacterium]|nr:DUF4097 family beta strand repeat protein [Pseudomonadales bacterium]